MKNSGELKRKTPMRQTGFKPSEPKPPKIKMRKCANRACRGPYMPDPKQPFKNWCSDDCGTAIGLEKLAKHKAAKQKAQRAEERRKKKENWSTKDWLKALEKVVNHYVLVRDKYEGCISCHMPSHYDGAWHASHFKSVGSNSALRFNIWNIHKGCAQCNLFKSGNIAEYERRLELKVGKDRVEWLKNQDRVRKYTPEYLERFINIMRKKTRRLIARQERKYHG